MNTNNEKPANELTLLGAIGDLIQVTYRIRGLVYQEGSGVSEKQEAVQPVCKIAQARNMIVDTTKELNEVADRLELLGE
jgi:hypothetical protein